MHKKIIIAAILLTILAIPTNTKSEFANASSKTITVPDDYKTIQAAVANASPGDTVFVRIGSYTGGIVVDKPMFTIMLPSSMSTHISVTCGEPSFISVLK